MRKGDDERSWNRRDRWIERTRKIMRFSRERDGFRNRVRFAVENSWTKDDTAIKCMALITIIIRTRKVFNWTRFHRDILNTTR